MIETKSIGLEEARQIAEKAVGAVSKAPGRPMSVAIVDNAGDLIYFVRMDGAGRNTGSLAQNKAYTAIRWQRDTEGLESFLKTENVDISWFGDPRYAPIHGGVPIKSSDGSIVGAIGISGRSNTEPPGDVEVALIGASAVNV